MLYPCPHTRMSGSCICVLVLECLGTVCGLVWVCVFLGGFVFLCGEEHMFACVCMCVFGLRELPREFDCMFVTSNVVSRGG